MDEFVENKLREWDLEVLVEQFKKNAIDAEVFNILEDTMINEIIPQVGLRYKFTSKYKQYLIEIIENSPIIIEDTDEHGSQSDSSFSMRSSVLSDKHENKIDSPHVTNVDGIPGSSRESPYRLTRSLTGLPENKPIFDLKKFLQSTLKGREVFLSYEKNVPKRSKLADILIENETDGNPDFRIRTQRFHELANSITEAFPNECSELYYIPWRKGADGPLSARGMLYDRYTNRRKVLREIGVISNTRQRNCDSNTSTENETEDVKVSLEWLKNNIEPFTAIEEKWKLTNHKRKIDFLNNEISEYFATFKCLQLPTGYILLDQDFDSVYEACSSRLFAGWPRIAQKIVVVAQKRNDLAVREYLSRYHELIASGTIDVLALMLLPLLLGTTCLKRKKGETSWRPSKIEVQDSFILHVETVDDLQPRWETKIKKNQKYKLRNQPLPAIVGPLSRIASSLLLIEETRYALPSPVKAVDSCFKAYFALNARYPEESRHVWSFIETYIYRIPDANKKGYVSVNKLISEIEAL